MNNALLCLLQLTDSTLPIGGYAHSAGLETYIQLNLVHDRHTARQFVTEMLSRNIQYTDAAFVSLAYEALAGNDIKKIISLDEMCSAVKLPREIREASQKLGKRLLTIFQPQIRNERVLKYLDTVGPGRAPGNYSILFGLFACCLGLSKEEALSGFYYNAAAGMITNCVKLVPLGQQVGQEILFALHPVINHLVEQGLVPDESKLGLSCTGFDIRCMQHEQLYSRLYMS